MEERPVYAKAFFGLTAASLSFTIYSLYRVFRMTQLQEPLKSVAWQRLRMVGQAGVIVGLTGPLVIEGFGWDIKDREGLGPFGIFSRTE